MRGMKFIKEVKNFKIGPAQKNKFEGMEVDIEGFFIDKTEITGIQTSNVYKGVGSNYYGNSIIENGKTSSPFVVYWNEKASGAKITLEYKYFPTRFSSISSYSSSALGTMYNSEQNKYSIPSTYTFTFLLLLRLSLI